MSRYFYRPVIHPWSLESIGPGLGPVGGNISSIGWPAANTAFFVPLWLPSNIIVPVLWVYNDSLAGNTDVGLYDHTGRRIVSAGSTAQSGSNTIQTFDIADTAIGPGLFYMGIARSTTGGTVRGATTTVRYAALMGMLEQLSAFPLPAPAVFARMSSNFVPLFGIVVGPRTVI